MKVKYVCALLLAAFTLVSGDGGAISLFNNATFSPYIHLTYNLTDGPKKAHLSPLISPGQTETVTFPDGAKNVHFFVYSETKARPLKPSELFKSIPYVGKHPNMCLMTWGPENNPQIGRIDCGSKAHALLSNDGGAISMTNDGTCSSRIILDYKLADDQGTRRLHKELPIKAGETSSIPIPDGARSIFVVLRAETLDIYGVTLSQPVKLCFRLWGTADVPQSAQIDCSA